MLPLAPQRWTLTHLKNHEVRFRRLQDFGFFLLQLCYIAVRHCLEMLCNQRNCCRRVRATFLKAYVGQRRERENVTKDGSCRGHLDRTRLFKLRVFVSATLSHQSPIFITYKPYNLEFFLNSCYEGRPYSKECFAIPRYFFNNNTKTEYSSFGTYLCLHFHLVAFDIKALVVPWHQFVYTLSISCGRLVIQPDHDSIFQVFMICEAFTSKILHVRKQENSDSARYGLYGGCLKMSQ